MWHFRKSDAGAPWRHSCRQADWHRPWGIRGNKIKLAPSNNSIKSKCLCLQMGCNGACSLYTLSWLDSFFPCAPAGTLRVFHTAWARSVASSMKPATHRPALFNSLGLDKACLSLLPSDQRANSLHRKESGAFCWVKWKIFVSCDQSMGFLQSLVPPLNCRNWWLLQVTDSFWGSI